MAPAVGKHLWRDSAPDSVDRDLAALWREVSARGPVARAVMSNLVVFRLGERRCAERMAADASPTSAAKLPDDLLDDVIARHPSRTIVVEHTRGDHAPGRPVGAQVGVSVFGPPSAQYAVERVVVRSACAAASWPSMVRRFARGDVPTSIWWTDDLSSAAAVEPLVATGRQLLYDSRRWRDLNAGIGIAAVLLEQGRLDLVDLNWRRLAQLRLALVQPAAVMPATVPAADVRIVHRPHDRALAMLLAGWLAARLNWAPNQWPAIAEGDLGGETLRLEIGGAKQMLVARLDERRVEIVQPGLAPLVVATSGEAEAEGIAAELRSLATDRGLKDAILAVARRAHPE